MIIENIDLDEDGQPKYYVDGIPKKIVLEIPILPVKFGLQKVGKNYIIKCALTGIAKGIAQDAIKEFYLKIGTIEQRIKELAIANQVKNVKFKPTFYQNRGFDPLIKLKVNYRYNKVESIFKDEINTELTMTEFGRKLNKAHVTGEISLNYLYSIDSNNDVIMGIIWTIKELKLVN